MAVASHTLGKLTKDLRDRLASGASLDGDTITVRIQFDQAFVDYLVKELQHGRTSVDVVPLSVEAQDLYVTIVADAREGA